MFRSYKLSENMIFRTRELEEAILLEAVKTKSTCKILCQKKKLKSSRWVSEDCLGIWIERSQKKIWWIPFIGIKLNKALQRREEAEEDLINQHDTSESISWNQTLSRRNSEVTLQKEEIPVIQKKTSDSGYQTQNKNSRFIWYQTQCQKSSFGVRLYIQRYLHLVSDATPIKLSLHLVSDAASIKLRHNWYQTQHCQS